MTDNRNVIDFYKYWDTAAIKSDLDTRRLPFISVFEHINGDFNKATGIRNHNAFLGNKVYIVGESAKRYDKRGAVGTNHYEDINFVKTIDDLIYQLSVEEIGLYKWVAVDNVEGAQNIYDYDFEENTILIFGEEQRGISEQMLTLCDDIVYIPQRGSVRSLNVGTASGIAMYEYCRKFAHN